MDGFSSIDLTLLPPPSRTVMRVLLRNPRISYADLRAEIDKLPENRRLDQQELDKSLASLCEKNWLKRSEENSKTIYSINMRQKSGSQDDGGKKNSGHLLQRLEEPPSTSDSDSPQKSKSKTNPLDFLG